jgi:hypothetical protein
MLTGDAEQIDAAAGDRVDPANACGQVRQYPRERRLRRSCGSSLRSRPFSHTTSKAMKNGAVCLEHQVVELVGARQQISPSMPAVRHRGASTNYYKA